MSHAFLHQSSVAPAGERSNRRGSSGRILGGPICLAVAIAIGAATLWAALIGWLSESIVSAPWARESIRVARDATPVIVDVDSNRVGNKYFTLDRKPYPSGAEGHWLDTAMISGGPLVAPQPPRSSPSIFSFSDGEPSPTAWYLVLSGGIRGTAYFVGYDFVSRRKVGYIGRNGFEEHEPTGDRAFDIRQTPGLPNLFLAPQSWWGGEIIVSLGESQPRRGKIPAWTCHLVSDDKLYRIDFRKRTAETVYQSPGLICVGQSSRPRAQTAVAEGRDSGSDSEDYLVVRSGDSLTILDPAAHPGTTYRLPPDLRTPWLQFCVGPGGNAVATYHQMILRERTSSQSVIEFAPDGSVSRTYPNVTRAGQPLDTPREAAKMAVILPEPVVAATVMFIFAPLFSEGSETKGYAAIVEDEFDVMWPMLLLTVIFGIFAVWLYSRHATRYGYSPHFAWATVVFLLGPAGYLGYRLHRHWPPRVACPTCKTPVPRDREACIDCGVEFPAAAKNGLEVFA